jgi:hypothetical protein
MDSANSAPLRQLSTPPPAQHPSASSAPLCHLSTPPPTNTYRSSWTILPIVTFWVFEFIVKLLQLFFFLKCPGMTTSPQISKSYTVHFPSVPTTPNKQILEMTITITAAVWIDLKNLKSYGLIEIQFPEKYKYNDVLTEGLRWEFFPTTGLHSKHRSSCIFEVVVSQAYQSRVSYYWNYLH